YKPIQKDSLFDIVVGGGREGVVERTQREWKRMGNSLGCSASGERLVSAARDGDLVEARMLLEFNPGLAKYSTFRGLNSPLHFAAAKGHNEVSRRPPPLFSALLKFVDKPADGGVTALHMAALSGYFDCVQLLLDLGANVSAVTFHYGAWLPLDVAKIWGRRCLEPLLNPNSELTVPIFPLSNYLSLPLMSLLNIARYSEAICLSFLACCGHELCLKCALYLCSASNTPSQIASPPGSIACPLCRNGIVSFVRLPGTPVKELKPNLALSLCNPCILHPRAVDIPATSCQTEVRRNRVAAVSSELICPLACTPFPSAIPSCATCDDDPFPSNESQGEVQSQRPPQSSHVTPDELEKMEEPRVDASCSGMFWSRRSCHREHQCNSEIDT
ncbi:hypothetical protein GW17_00035523, partial [Ensete ventricosum]